MSTKLVSHHLSLISHFSAHPLITLITLIALLYVRISINSFISTVLLGSDLKAARAKWYQEKQAKRKLKHSSGGKISKNGENEREMELGYGECEDSEASHGPKEQKEVTVTTLITLITLVTNGAL